MGGGNVLEQDLNNIEMLLKFFYYAVQSNNMQCNVTADVHSPRHFHPLNKAAACCVWSVCEVT